MCGMRLLALFSGCLSSSSDSRGDRKRQLMVYGLTVLTVLLLVLLFASGCQTDERRAVLIPPIVVNPETLVPSDIIRVGPNVKGRIWFPSENGGWELSSNEVSLPEGWYLIPPPNSEEEDGS